MIGYIYKFTLITTGKIYIGKRQRPKFDNSYWGSGIYWLRAVKQHGGTNAIKREVLEWCETREKLNEREKYWVKQLDARNPNVGYNIAPGGDGGNLGDEVIIRIAEKLRGKPSWNAGKTGIYSDETRAKMSKAKKNKKSWNAGRSDIYSAETLLKMKQAAFNRSAHHKITCIENSKIYQNTEEVCIDLQIENTKENRYKILRCCEGYRKSFNNLHFKFMEK